MSTDIDLGRVPALRPGTGERAGISGRTRIRLLQLGTFVIVLVIWEVLSATSIISQLALPTVPKTAVAFFTNFGNPDYWTAVGETLEGALGGLVLAAVIGVPLGLVTGTYARVERSSRLLIDILRSFPVIAVLPVFLLVIGSTMQMKITVVFIACVFPILLQAQYGAQSVTPMIAETIRSYRIPRLLQFRRVILPAAWPSILTGFRLGATTSVLVAIGVELLTTLPGIGHAIVLDQQGGNSPLAYSYIITTGLLGYGVNKLALLIETRLLAWRPADGTE